MYIVASSKKRFQALCEEYGTHPSVNVWVHSYDQIKNKVLHERELLLDERWSDINDNALKARIKEIKGW